MTDNRVNQLIGLVPINKTVLNVGCAQNPQLHHLLAGKSAGAVGIDIDAKGIRALKKKGYRVFTMNAEEIRFKEKFDCIIAGELIEHLNNPGLFLEKAYEHLNPKGKLIITTPNISSIFLYLLVVCFDKTQDPTHVYYFDEKNLKALVQRYRFKINQTSYVPPEIKFHGQTLLFKIVFFMTTALSNLGFLVSRRLFGSYLLLVLEK